VCVCFKFLNPILYEYDREKNPVQKCFSPPTSLSVVPLCVFVMMRANFWKREQFCFVFVSLFVCVFVFVSVWEISLGFLKAGMWLWSVVWNYQQGENTNCHFSHPKKNENVFLSFIFFPMIEFSSFLPHPPKPHDNKQTKQTKQN